MFKKKLGSHSLALKVENRVKRLSKTRKEELIVSKTYINKIIKQFGLD